MILESHLGRGTGGFELHLRLLRGARVSDFLGKPDWHRTHVPSVAERTVVGVEFRFSISGGLPYVSWYHQANVRGYHVTHGTFAPLHRLAGKPA